MKFTMSRGGGSPPGTYRARFDRIEEFDENVEKFGPGVKLVFSVLEGDQKDVENSAVCSAKLSPKSNLGGFALAMKGGPIEMDEEFDFANKIGTVGTIVVEDAPSGNGTKVSTFFPER